MSRRVRFLAAVLTVGALFIASRTSEIPPATVGAAPGRVTVEAAQPSDQLGSLMSCRDVQGTFAKGGFTDPQLVLTDAELIPGSSGARFCLFWDELADAYGAFPINVRNADHFRAVKWQMLDLLPDAGIDLCKIGFVGPTSNSVSRTTSPDDWHDVGRPCEPELYAHGPQSEARMGEVRTALAQAKAKGEELFGWAPTWPMRIFVYDNQTEYGEGIRADGRAGKAANLAKKTAGLTLVSSSFMTVITIDQAKLDHPDLVSTVTVHEYAHVLQYGVLGCACNVPGFAIEGGAEYITHLTLGGDNLGPKMRFQAAVDELAEGKATPLSSMTKATYDGAGAYHRGLAFFRFLDERYGAGTFVQLYHENAGGTPDLYLRNLSSLTGKTLDQLDREMNEWLRGFPATPKPANRRN